MTIQIKYVVIVCLVTAAVSASITRYYFPQVTVQTKTVEADHSVTHNDVKTVTHEVKKPDGEVDTDITTIDSTVHTDTDTKTAQVVQLAPEKNWYVGATASITGVNFANPAYGVQVNRRILGPIFLGGTVNTKGEFGISLGMEF